MIYSPSSLTLQNHYYTVAKAITKGKVVFFLGDEINLCGRRRNDLEELESWRIDDNPPKYAPTNIELALYLDKISDKMYSQVVCCPLTKEDLDHLPNGCPLKTDSIKKMALQQVSQYIELLSGQLDMLPGTLGPIFEAEYPSNPLHRFLADLPKRMKAKGYPHRCPLSVTTCFDNTLERAFKEAGQPFDLVSFIGREKGGQFVHQKFRPLRTSAGAVQIIEEGETVPIEAPDEYQDEGLSLDLCPVILKLYGAIESGENLIITEDHYIDYLAHKDLRNLLPRQLSKILIDNHILFLGYSPIYWNLRVILHRIWADEIFSQAKKTWWAIQSNPEIIESKFWMRYTGQEPISISLEDYIAELNNQVQKQLDKIVPRVSSPPSDKITTPIKQRKQVFVSYSHKDTEWLERLQTFLDPAIYAKKILPPWTDSQIKPGEKWFEKIEEALASAKVAVLLVSQNFLASDFIRKEELPPLLEAAEKEGVKIIWIYLNYCSYKYTALKNLQAAHKISDPLESLPKPEQDRILNEICDEIVAAVEG